MYTTPHVHTVCTSNRVVFVLPTCLLAWFLTVCLLARLLGVPPRHHPLLIHSWLRWNLGFHSPQSIGSPKPNDSIDQLPLLGRRRRCCRRGYANTQSVHTASTVGRGAPRCRRYCCHCRCGCRSRRGFIILWWRTRRLEDGEMHHHRVRLDRKSLEVRVERDEIFEVGKLANIT